MERIDVRELMQNTGQVLARVRRGDIVEVTERGHPIARPVPVRHGGSLLDQLVAEGRAVAPATGGPIPLPPVLGDPAVDVAQELAASRS